MSQPERRPDWRAWGGDVVVPTAEDILTSRLVRDWFRAIDVFKALARARERRREDPA